MEDFCHSSHTIIHAAPPLCAPRGRTFTKMHNVPLPSVTCGEQISPTCAPPLCALQGANFTNMYHVPLKSPFGSRGR